MIVKLPRIRAARAPRGVAVMLVKFLHVQVFLFQMSVCLTIIIINYHVHKNYVSRLRLCPGLLKKIGCSMVYGFWHNGMFFDSLFTAVIYFSRLAGSSTGLPSAMDTHRALPRVLACLPAMRAPWACALYTCRPRAPASGSV